MPTKQKSAWQISRAIRGQFRHFQLGRLALHLGHTEQSPEMRDHLGHVNYIHKIAFLILIVI